MTKLEEIYSNNAISTYKRLYLARNKNNEICEDINTCHIRIAHYLAESQEEFENFTRLLDEQKFRPNTPCMANAGVKENPMMLACFVLDLQDNMDSIIDMWSTCAKIYEGGGGAGIPITNLRKKGAGLTNGGYASGPLSYMNVIEVISEEIKSGGKQRRAANLLAAKYNHPDIIDIINCKRSKETFKSMNLSISVDNKFMNKVDNDLYPDNTNKQVVHIEDPNDGKTGQTISAIGIWNHICEAAWETGDPGLLFIDRVNEDNPLDIPIESTNPCGESPLWPNCCCDLGHMNLNKYYGPDDPAFELDIYWAILFLNRIIDKSAYPNKEFEKNMKKYRPIGLGLMGFADVLYKKQIAYGSIESLDLIDQYTSNLTKFAFRSSGELAAYSLIPNINFNLNDHEKIKFVEVVSKFVDIDSLDMMPANITVTTLAPTGSTAMSADCSYSTEPMFGLIWTKILDDGDTMEFLDPNFEKALASSASLISIDKKDLFKKIKNNKGSIRGISMFPDWMRKAFVTAHDISNKQRILVQAAAQKNITMAVSSTVNLPNSATIDDVSDIYFFAWQCDLKGITVYRDGSLDNQPVDFGTKSESQEAHTEEESHDPSKEKDNMKSISSEEFLNRKPFGKNYKRPKERNSKTYEANTPDGKLYVTGGFDNGYLMETFISIGKQGRRENTFLNGLGRVISKALQRGVDLDEITDTLRGTGGDSFFFKLNEEEKSLQVNGVLDALALILDNKFAGEHLLGTVNEIQSEQSEQSNVSEYDRCPECERFTLRRDAGCRGGVCAVCGYSNCG